MFKYYIERFLMLNVLTISLFLSFCSESKIRLMIKFLISYWDWEFDYLFSSGLSIQDLQQFLVEQFAHAINKYYSLFTLDDRWKVIFASWINFLVTIFFYTNTLYSLGHTNITIRAFYIVNYILSIMNAF